MYNNDTVIDAIICQHDCTNCGTEKKWRPQEQIINLMVIEFEWKKIDGYATYIRNDPSKKHNKRRPQ